MLLKEETLSFFPHKMRTHHFSKNKIKLEYDERI